jgi:hypothetical protein
MKVQAVRLASPLFIGLRLAACAALLCGWSGQLAAQDGAQPAATCCASISEFQFHPLPAGQEVEFSLTPEGPTFAFEERAQRFIALKIPDDFVGTTIQVRMYLASSFLSRTSAVVPEFIYLGANFKVVERQITKGFQEAGGFFRIAVLGRAEVPPDARYIVVVASDGSKGHPTYNVGGGRAFNVPAATEGDFTLRLFGQSAAKPATDPKQAPEDGQGPPQRP